MVQRRVENRLAVFLPWQGTGFSETSGEDRLCESTSDWSFGSPWKIDTV